MCVTTGLQEKEHRTVLHSSASAATHTHVFITSFQCTQSARRSQPPQRALCLVFLWGALVSSSWPRAPGSASPCSRPTPTSWRRASGQSSSARWPRERSSCVPCSGRAYPALGGGGAGGAAAAGARRSPQAAFWVPYLDVCALSSAEQLLKRSGWVMSQHFGEYSQGETAWDDTIQERRFLRRGREHRMRKRKRQ